MAKKNKDTINNTNTNNNTKKGLTKPWPRSWKVLAVALYITFLLLSSIPFMADTLIEPELKDVYKYHLTYPTDGRQGHYYIERVDTDMMGTIDLVYTPSSNSLSINSKNIEVLHVYCRSMYEDECKKVFGFDPADNYNYYKWYFIEKDHLTVNIESDHKINELSFIDTPTPYEVYVNGLLWYEGRQYNYTDSDKTVLSNVPKGTNHVDIYFKTPDKSRPRAVIKADRTVVNINTPVHFDSNGSYDVDGDIKSRIWDFGDGNNSGGVVNSHTYLQPGVYTVILTVRDNDFMVDHAYLNITVIKGTTKPVINGEIPNQLREEDSPPWEIDLKPYGMDFDGAVSDLLWYVTGENESLYNLVGENSSEQKLIFSLLPNAFGNNYIRIYLKDKDGYNSSQQLWINITPVNDRPIFRKLPHLIVHYDVPYRFSIVDYISDVETPYDELDISVSDQYGSSYLTFLGEEIILEYPKDYMGQDIFITYTASDGDAGTNAVQMVTVSDNWPPILMDSLPDITIEEGGTIINAFKLDDYFSDPDEEELYYTYSESSVGIEIKDDTSVNFYSRNHWVGEENVIFRAEDTHGAIMEDSIKVSVIPINDPPEIGDVPDLKVHYDLEYNFDVSYYISDDDNELYELILTTSDPKHIKVNPENNLGIIVKYPKSMLGITTKVVLTVSDGTFMVSKPIYITVMNEYPPELIKRLPDVSFNEDEKLSNAIDLDNHFLDLDNDTLYYTTGNVMVEVTIDPMHQVNFDSKPNWFGSEKVIFRATDPSGALVEDSIIVTVVPINDPPILKPLPKLVINESETVELKLLDYLFDVDDNVSHLIITVDDQNVFVSGTSLVIFGSKTLPREIDIMVSDGVYSVTRTLETKVVTKKVKMEDNIDELISYFVLIIIAIIVGILSLFIFYRYRMQKYDVEEIFLIHNSGKLLNHVYCKTHSKFDDEIFSGMFTAIQEFIEDTFTNNSDNENDNGKDHDLDIEDNQSAGPVSISKIKALTFRNNDNDVDRISKKPLKLNEFKVGDNQVIIEHGQFIFMAVVYTGPGSRTLHRVIKNTIGVIEDDYGENLEYWDGDVKQIEGLKDYLDPLLPEQEPEEVSELKLDMIQTKLKIGTFDKTDKESNIVEKNNSKIRAEARAKVKSRSKSKSDTKSKSRNPSRTNRRSKPIIYSQTKSGAKSTRRDKKDQKDKKDRKDNANVNIKAKSKKTSKPITKRIPITQIQNKFL
jgi:PKD repeat protein